jgi:hypothetical protein
MWTLMRYSNNPHQKTGRGSDHRKVNRGHRKVSRRVPMRRMKSYIL